MEGKHKSLIDKITSSQEEIQKKSEAKKQAYLDRSTSALRKALFELESVDQNIQ